MSEAPIKWRYTLTWDEVEAGGFMTDYRSETTALKQFARVITLPAVTKAKLTRWTPSISETLVAIFSRNGVQS